jgi:hypothetical protein
VGDGDLTADIVTTNNVDTSTVGSYMVIYDVTDSSGNTATAVRTVNVVDTTVTLSISKSGTGDGTVNSNPAGIDCGTDCSEDYTHNTPVVLSPTADAGSTFIGWTGPDVSDLSDNGDGTWSIIMDAAKEITAIFNVVQYSVTITVVGSGTVNNTPGNPYAYNETAILEPVAEPNWAFAGWSGTDSASLTDNGDGTWSITMDDDKEITATFTYETGILGDVNGDEVVNSTDALIILSGDAGLDVLQFCPMNCGDVNADGFVNSTDALIVLSYDVGMTVPYPVGEPGCPATVTPCPGCIP